MTAGPPPAEPQPIPATISLPGSVVEAALAHARAEAPNEACGLIGGDRRRSRGTVFHPARNALASPYRFDLDPADLVEILDLIERADLELVATFHSHPRTPAVPSALDRREARHRVVHLVASLSGDVPELRAWWIEGGVSREVTLRVEEAYRDVAVPDPTSRMTSIPGDPSSPPDR